MSEIPRFPGARPTYEAECGGKRLRVTEAEPVPHDLNTLDLSRFGADAELIRENLNALEVWINDPVIEDDFIDHNDRRAWENTLPQDIRTFLDNNNKLGMGQVMSAMNILQILPAMIDPHDPELAAQLRMTCKSIPNIIQEMRRAINQGLTGKGTYISLLVNIDAMARRVLELFLATPNKP